MSFNLICGNKIYITAEWYYTIFNRKGRIILAPCEELKKAQKYFLWLIKREYPLKINTFNSAYVHTGKKWVMKMDIKDFFNSVPYEDIEMVVKKACSHLKYPNISYYLDLTTVDKKLPTGAPTSAHIANACFQHVEKPIRNYCMIFGVDYTRYMDDLTFSGNNKADLEKIEKRVKAILKEYGYSINKKKTKYISENKQQNVLGLVVNKDKVRLQKEFKRKIRAMVHRFVCYKKAPLHNDIWRFVDEQKLNGYLAYIKEVDNNFYLQIRLYKKRLEKKYNKKK